MATTPPSSYAAIVAAAHESNTCSIAGVKSPTKKQSVHPPSASLADGMTVLRVSPSGFQLSKSVVRSLNINTTTLSTTPVSPSSDEAFSYVNNILSSNSNMPNTVAFKDYSDDHDVSLITHSSDTFSSLSSEEFNNSSSPSSEDEPQNNYGVCDVHQLNNNGHIGDYHSPLTLLPSVSSSSSSVVDVMTNHNHYHHSEHAHRSDSDCHSKTLIISVDVEVDGPVPNINSLRMLGVCAIDPALIDQSDPSCVRRAIVSQREWCVAPQRDRVSNPHNMNFLRKQGSLMEYIEARQLPIEQVMHEFIVDWFSPLKESYRHIEWVAKPSYFDRMWIEVLFHQYKPAYIPDDFLGHHVACLRTCLRMVAWLHPHIPYDKIEDMFNPFKLPYTHHALDDAIHQGIKYCLLRKYIKQLGRNKRSSGGGGAVVNQSVPLSR